MGLSESLSTDFTSRLLLSLFPTFWNIAFINSRHKGIGIERFQWAELIEWRHKTPTDSPLNSSPSTKEKSTPRVFSASHQRRRSWGWKSTHLSYLTCVSVATLSLLPQHTRLSTPTLLNAIAFVLHDITDIPQLKAAFRHASDKTCKLFDVVSHVFVTRNRWSRAAVANGGASRAVNKRPVASRCARLLLGGRLSNEVAFGQERVRGKYRAVWICEPCLHLFVFEA